MSSMSSVTCGYAIDFTSSSSNSLLNSKGWEGRLVCVVDIARQTACATIDLGKSVLNLAVRTAQIAALYTLPTALATPGAFIGYLIFTVPMPLADIIFLGGLGSLSIGLSIYSATHFAPQNIDFPLDVLTHLSCAIPCNLIYRTIIIAADTLGIILPSIGKAARTSSFVNKFYIPLHKIDYNRSFRTSGIFTGTHLSFLEKTTYTPGCYLDIGGSWWSAPKWTVDRIENMRYSDYRYGWSNGSRHTESVEQFINLLPDNEKKRIKDMLSHAEKLFNEDSFSSYQTIKECTEKYTERTTWNFEKIYNLTPWRYNNLKQFEKDSLQKFINSLTPQEKIKAENIISKAMELSNASYNYDTRSFTECLADHNRRCTWSLTRIEGISYYDYTRLSSFEKQSLQSYIHSLSAAQKKQVEDLISHAETIYSYGSYSYKFKSLKELHTVFLEKCSWSVDRIENMSAEEYLHHHSLNALEKEWIIRCISSFPQAEKSRIDAMIYRAKTLCGYLPHFKAKSLKECEEIYLEKSSWSISRIENITFYDFNKLDAFEKIHLEQTIIKLSYAQRQQINEMISNATAFCKQTPSYRHRPLKECSEEFIKRQSNASSNSASSSTSSSPAASMSASFQSSSSTGPWSLEKILNYKYSAFNALSTVEKLILNMFINSLSEEARKDISNAQILSDKMCALDSSFKEKTLKECREEYIKHLEAQAPRQESISLDEKREAYTDLGLSPGASWEAVAKAYRKLAVQFHSDKNLESQTDGSNANQKWHKIASAYQKLKIAFNK